jgi:hypothetical protein
MGNLAFATAMCLHRIVIKVHTRLNSPIQPSPQSTPTGASNSTIHQLLPSQLFLGSLRDLEHEMIRERLSSTIMESLLALTIFREEFSSFFVAMFATLVFIKVMHWLVQDRVDYVEVTPSVSSLQHVRLVSFMTTLLVSGVGRRGHFSTVTACMPINAH